MKDSTTQFQTSPSQANNGGKHADQTLDKEGKGEGDREAESYHVTVDLSFGNSVTELTKKGKEMKVIQPLRDEVAGKAHGSHSRETHEDFDPNEGTSLSHEMAGWGMEKKIQDLKGKGKAIADDSGLLYRDHISDRQSRLDSDSHSDSDSDSDDDVIWQPSVAKSTIQTKLDQHEIDEMKRKWIAQTELYENNLAKGIPYEETSRMLHRGDLAIEV